MSNEFVLGKKVRLNSFNGEMVASQGCRDTENYWKVIGRNGVIVEPENARGRVLVKFEESIEAFGLHCHNPIENSLYILISYLVTIVEL